jgi:hypothetical protein
MIHSEQADMIHGLDQSSQPTEAELHAYLLTVVLVLQISDSLRSNNKCKWLQSIKWVSCCATMLLFSDCCGQCRSQQMQTMDHNKPASH